MPDPASAVMAWLMAPGLGEELPTLEDLVHRPAWMARAQCQGEDRALFFPSRGTRADKAKALCATCPVRQECLSYALADPESAGVWGGFAERERQGMRDGRGVA